MVSSAVPSVRGEELYHSKRCRVSSWFLIINTDDFQTQQELVNHRGCAPLFPITKKDRRHYNASTSQQVWSHILQKTKVMFGPWAILLRLSQETLGIRACCASRISLAPPRAATWHRRSWLVLDMAWRSPFQTSKSGGVPFPALTPWANSPGQLSESGSPMQTSPTPILKSVIKRGMPGTNVRGTSSRKVSPMDAAPYTPLSARRDIPGPATGSGVTDGFVGKLSFTPHASQHRARSSARNRSPDSIPDDRTTSSNLLAQPPQASLYVTEPRQPRAASPSLGEQLSTANICATYSLCCIFDHHCFAPMMQS